MTTKGRRGRSPGVNGADAIPAATPSEYGVEMATGRTVKRPAAKTGKTAKKKVAERKTAMQKGGGKRVATQKQANVTKVAARKAKSKAYSRHSAAKQADRKARS